MCVESLRAFDVADKIEKQKKNIYIYIYDAGLPHPPSPPPPHGIPPAPPVGWAGGALPRPAPVVSLLWWAVHPPQLRLWLALFAVVPAAGDTAHDVVL